MTLAEIERLTQAYAAAIEEVRGNIEALETEIRQLKRRKYPGLFLRAQKAAQAKADLKAAVGGAPDLFMKPRTRVIAGVKVGFQKGKGEVVIPDEARTVALIKRHFADQAEILIKTTEKPLKKAIAQLSAADAKRIGAEISATGDEVVIKVMAGEVEKIVDAFFQDMDEDGLAAAQE